MDWPQVLVMIATLAGLFLWNRSEANSDRRMFQQILIGIQDEMKDFHGRLEKQDAEFKTRLLAIEEKRRQ